MRNILYIVPSDYDSLEKKGVINLILERDEGSFFDKVLTLHPFTKNDKVIDLKENNKVIEYGWKSKFNFLNIFLLTKIFGTFIILFKLAFIFPFIIKKEKISIIRATDPYYMGLIGFCYSKLLNIPFVVSVHSDYDMGEKLGGQTFKILGSRKIAKKLEKFVYHQCDLILPISDYLKQNIIKEYGVNINKIKIFYHGISFNDFDNTLEIDIRKRFNINKKQYIIGYVARLSKEKNCLDILKIGKKLKEKKLNILILVVGNGMEFNYMKSFIENNYLDKYVKLLGFQEKNIVYNIRKQSNINLCLLDGFSLIEACAGLNPIIAYNTEWHYELINNNTTGYLVEVNNIDEVVEKIIFLSNNQKESKAIGKKARDIAFKNHDINNTTNVKQNIYKAILQ